MYPTASEYLWPVWYSILLASFLTKKDDSLSMPRQPRMARRSRPLKNHVRYLGSLEDFDAPRELSFLLHINDRCSASQSNDLDGLTSSINLVLKHLAVTVIFCYTLYTPRAREACTPASCNCHFGEPQASVMIAVPF